MSYQVQNPVVHEAFYGTGARVAWDPPVSTRGACAAARLLLHVQKKMVLSGALHIVSSRPPLIPIIVNIDHKCLSRYLFTLLEY